MQLAKVGSRNSFLVNLTSNPTPYGSDRGSLYRRRSPSIVKLSCAAWHQLGNSDMGCARDEPPDRSVRVKASDSVTQRICHSVVPAKPTVHPKFFSGRDPYREHHARDLT